MVPLGKLSASRGCCLSIALGYPWGLKLYVIEGFCLGDFSPPFFFKKNVGLGIINLVVDMVHRLLLDNSQLVSVSLWSCNSWILCFLFTVILFQVCEMTHPRWLVIITMVHHQMEYTSVKPHSTLAHNISRFPNDEARKFSGQVGVGLSV